MRSTLTLLTECLLSWLCLQMPASGDVRKLICMSGSTKYYGTVVAVGAVSDGRTVFYTAAHCVRPNRNGVWIASAKDWHKATVVDAEYNSEVDYAILLAKVPRPRFERIRSKPAKGERVSFAGYAMGKYRTLSGSVSDWTQRGHGFFARGDETISGQSGGPCWDAKGNLVGIISSHGKGESVFTTAGYINSRWGRICSPFG